MRADIAQKQSAHTEPRTRRHSALKLELRDFGLEDARLLTILREIAKHAPYTATVWLQSANLKESVYMISSQFEDWADELERVANLLEAEQVQHELHENDAKRVEHV